MPIYWSVVAANLIDAQQCRMPEMVQRQAARYVLHRYHNTSSASKMLDTSMDIVKGTEEATASVHAL